MLTGGDSPIDTVMASKGKKNELIIVPQSTMPTGEDSCIYCGRKGHTQDTCFKLHGYPIWWKECKWRNRRTDQLNVADQDGSSGRVAVLAADTTTIATILNIAQVPSTYSAD